MRFKQVQRFIHAKKIFWGYGHFNDVWYFNRVLTWSGPIVEALLQLIGNRVVDVRVKGGDI